jgi:DNA end-binding protein Ku
VRDEKDYFDDIPDESVPKDMLELATHIVHSKAGHFKPDKFEDKYESALKEIIKRKQHGEKIEAPKDKEPAKVIDLMEALRRSAKGAPAPARRNARTATRRTAKKSSRGTTARRKAG